jgi:hypothetical protein
MAFEIIREKPAEFTRELRGKLGYVAIRLWNGQMAWVHETKMREMTDQDVEQMARDLYDEEWQQKIRGKIFR